MTHTGNNKTIVSTAVNQAIAVKVAQHCRKLIQGDFGFFSSTKSTHPLARESLKDHKNTTAKNRNRVKKLTDGKRRRFVTRAVAAGLAASKWIDWFTVPVVWKEISHISMTEWREVPEFLQVAWYISAYMKEHGKRYCAFTLNLGKDLLGTESWISKTPEEIKALKKQMQDHLRTAIPKEYERMFSIELDSEGRPHIHGIVFGCTKHQLDSHREAIKKAGGQWSGNNSKHQLVIKERQNFNDAIGWISYSTKDSDDYLYIPQQIRDNGKAHYIATKQKIDELQDSNRIHSSSKHTVQDTNQLDVQPAVMAPAESKVLEKTAPIQSKPENIGSQNLKSASEPTESAVNNSSSQHESWGTYG